MGTGVDAWGLKLRNCQLFGWRVGWRGVGNKASLNLIKITELSSRGSQAGGFGWGVGVGAWVAGGGEASLISLKLRNCQLSA